MIRIAELTLREIRMTLREPFRISSGATHQRRVVLVEARDPDGAVGWGECVAGESPHYSPETVETAWLALRTWIAPVLLRQSFPEPGTVHALLHTAFRGHPMAKATAEMAVWALAAERRQIPLASLLGGTRRHVAVGISLGIQDDPEQLARRAVAARGEGYRRVKLKIRPQQDLDYVAAVREAVGSDLALSADANGAYTPEDGDHLCKLDAYDLVMLEQPFPAGDLVRHAGLRRTMATPLCLDESIDGIASAEDAVALGSCRILNIKPGRVGGHGPALAINDIAGRHTLTAWCGGMLETGIGRAHNVALASLENFRHPGDLSPSRRYWDRDIVLPEWTMQDGLVEVPWDRAGLGVEVDRDRVDDLTTRMETLR